MPDRGGGWLIAFALLALLAPPLPIEIAGSAIHPAMIVGAWGLWRALGSRFPRDGAGLPLLALAAWLLWTCCAAALNAGWAVAAAGAARVGLLGIAVAAYLELRRATPRVRPPLLVWLAMAAGLAACLEFVLQLEPATPFAEQYVWLAEARLRRAQGFFYDAGQLGGFCVFGLTGLLTLALHPVARRELGIPTAPALAAAVALGMALLFSFSRASMLALAVAAVAATALARVSVPVLARAFATTALAGGLALAAAFALAGEFTAIYWDRFRYSVWQMAVEPAAALGQRLDSWRLLLDFVAERPATLLWGLGYKTLPVAGVDGRPVIADNMYVSLTVEAGLIGLTLALALLTAVLWSGLRAAASRRPVTAFVGAWAAAFWASQVVQMFWVDLLTYWRLLPLYFALVALAERRSAAEAAG